MLLLDVTLPTGVVQDIVISMFVCLFVCPLAYISEHTPVVCACRLWAWFIHPYSSLVACWGEVFYLQFPCYDMFQESVLLAAHCSRRAVVGDDSAACTAQVLRVVCWQRTHAVCVIVSMMNVLQHAGLSVCVPCLCTLGLP